MIDLSDLLRRLDSARGSDLHLRVDQPPRWRTHGELTVVPEQPAATAADIENVVAATLSPAQRRRFDDDGEIDCACTDAAGTRYRANFFRDHSGVAAALRRIPTRIQTLAELALPDEVEALAHLRRGLVLVTGETGSGKSSTLAALIDIVNHEYVKHIVTLEDPIEFVHESQRSLVLQRAIGDDVPTFARGVRDALRADADVLLVGELRDLDTTRAALTAAETGMLVYGTLHTTDATQSIERVVDVFPVDEQAQVRAMLAESLAAVLTQTLLKRKDGAGRVPAIELLLRTPAISALIREGRSHEIQNFLQGGKAKGMCRLNDSLDELVRRGLIDHDEAAARR